jgi:circadian clock protein KaiB
MNWEPRSAAAMANLKQLCEQHLEGKYKIHVVDLIKTPHRSQEDQILAIPTVVRRFPLPEKRVIGTLSNGKAAAVALEMANANSE